MFFWINCKKHMLVRAIKMLSSTPCRPASIFCYFISRSKHSSQNSRPMANPLIHPDKLTSGFFFAYIYPWDTPEESGLPDTCRGIPLEFFSKICNAFKRNLENNFKRAGGSISGAPHRPPIPEGVPTLMSLEVGKPELQRPHGEAKADRTRNKTNYFLNIPFNTLSLISPLGSSRSGSF